MVTLAELEDYLTDFLESEKLRDCCPNGVQVEACETVEHIGVAVTASLETIQEAANQDIDLLIVHHGIFWNGDDPVLRGSKKEKIELLLQNQISLMAYHLPLDAHQEIGNNWKAAELMQWRNLAPFGEVDGVPIGVKGSFDALDIGEFQEMLEQFYQHKAHVALGGCNRVRTAALVSGGAYKLIPEAAKEGVDCFITGNFDEPAWHMAHEGGVNFFALGHSATERIGPQALGEHLQERFGLRQSFLDLFNPF